MDKNYDQILRIKTIIFSREIELKKDKKKWVKISNYIFKRKFFYESFVALLERTLDNK